MMMHARHVGFFLLMLGLVACRQDGLDSEDAVLLDEGKSAEPAVGGANLSAPARNASVVPPVVHATVLSDSVVAIGAEISGEGKAVAPKPVYGSDDVVHASVKAGGHPAGQSVTIYWFGPNGSSVKTETSEIKAGATFVNFQLRKADGMKAGAYSAQVDIGDVPFGMADFRVQ